METRRRPLIEHDPEKKVYHGTGADIEVFDYRFCEIGNDQLGSGFYFTDFYPTANDYSTRLLPGKGAKPGGDCANVIVAQLDLNNPISPDTVATLTVAQIRQIMLASPYLDEALTNWGDVESDGREKVLRMAAKTYAMPDAPVLDIFNNLSNDFFKGAFGTFAKAVRDATGYDGVIAKQDDEETHYVAWFPDQITFYYANLKPEPVRRPRPR